MKSVNCIFPMKQRYLEFFRFCIVGAFCTFLDIAIFYICRIIFTYLFSVIFAYCGSLTANYFLTVYWTFKSKANAKNAVGLILTHLFSLFVLRMGLMWFLVEVGGWNEDVAYFLPMIIAPIFVFLMTRFCINKTRLC